MIGIDPGPEQSAIVILHDDGSIENCGLLENQHARAEIQSSVLMGPVVIEDVTCYGMAVGRDVFETIFWIGRFFDVSVEASLEAVRLPRADVKMILCNSRAAKDANVRQALMNYYGGEKAARGCKKAPGPLYGISKHAWSALAVAVAWKIREGKDKDNG